VVSSLLYSLYFNLSIVSQLKLHQQQSSSKGKGSSTGTPLSARMKGAVRTGNGRTGRLLLDYQSSIHYTDYQYLRWVDVPQGVTGTVRTSRTFPVITQRQKTDIQLPQVAIQPWCPRPKDQDFRSRTKEGQRQRLPFLLPSRFR
jgi:hypothetical protein